MTATSPMAGLDEILGDLTSGLAGIFEVMEWAESEIANAQKRHPAQADMLHHCFALVKPQEHMWKMTNNEAIYRAHARELLERVITGTDMRPGTDAEICIAMSEVSQVTPMRPEACGLYARAFSRIMPDASPWVDREEHYEALYAAEIDDTERETRHKLADAERVLSRVECGGRHHGEDATGCRFYAPPAEAAA
jgi:hypothetical protein